MLDSPRPRAHPHEENRPGCQSAKVTFRNSCVLLCCTCAHPWVHPLNFTNNRSRTEVFFDRGCNSQLRPPEALAVRLSHQHTAASTTEARSLRNCRRQKLRAKNRPIRPSPKSGQPPFFWQPKLLGLLLKKITDQRLQLIEGSFLTIWCVASTAVYSNRQYYKFCRH